MTLAKSRLTTLLASDKGHSYIETCLLSVGCSEGSVTTNAATVGPTQEATAKIIDLQTYVSKQ
jgi:precorrin-6B methylase 2